MRVSGLISVAVQISVALHVVETVGWHLLAGEYPANRKLVGVS
jgi:hypothetical protein